MESSRKRFMARSGIRDDIFGKVVPFQGKFLPLFKFDILFIVCFWYSFIVCFFFLILVNGIVLITRLLGTSSNFVNWNKCFTHLTLISALPRSGIFRHSQWVTITKVQQLAIILELSCRTFRKPGEFNWWKFEILR